MKTIVVYGGRFHPFHKGHFATYQHLTKKYGADSVYVVSSAKQEAGTSPFSFADKYYMMLVCGVQVDHIVQVVSPYQPKEITGTVDQENTRIIFALSAKDAERFTFAPKKDGSPSYMQPLPKNLDECNPLSQSGYVDIVPVVTFQILGTEVTSASEIRKLYIEGNVDYRQKIITELYGRYDPKLYDIFNNALLPAVAESFKYARMLKYIKESMPTATTEQKKEFVRLLESLQVNEAPIEMDKEEPNDPMVYAPGTNPGKLSYRKQRAIAQLNALNEFAKAGQWDRVVQLFPELQMNVDAVRHGMEELQKVRSRGGINSRGINP
jgi:hypothetical protein